MLRPGDALRRRSSDARKTSLNVAHEARYDLADAEVAEGQTQVDFAVHRFGHAEEFDRVVRQAWMIGPSEQLVADDSPRLRVDDGLGRAG